MGTILGLLLLASCSLITALFNHILNYDGITQYPHWLLTSFALGDAMFHYRFHNTLQLKLLLAVPLILTLTTKKSHLPEAMVLIK